MTNNYKLFVHKLSCLNLELKIVRKLFYTFVNKEMFPILYLSASLNLVLILYLHLRFLSEGK
jgi:hypothetical protein